MADKPPVDGEDGNARVRAEQAFMRGDYARSAELASLLIDGATTQEAQTAGRALRKRVSFDPVMAAVLSVCLLFLVGVVVGYLP